MYFLINQSIFLQRGQMDLNSILPMLIKVNLVSLLVLLETVFVLVCLKLKDLAQRRLTRLLQMRLIRLLTTSESEQRQTSLTRRESKFLRLLVHWIRLELNSRKNTSLKEKRKVSLSEGST